MSEKRVLTQEIVEEIIDNLSPEEKTLDFSEFTSSEVSLESIEDFLGFKTINEYNFDGFIEIPDDFALKIARDFAENDRTIYSFKGLSELNKTFKDNVIRIPYGKIILPEKFVEVERSLFTLDSSKVKKIIELDQCHDDSRWIGFKYITAAAAYLVAKEGGGIFWDLVEITPEVATALAQSPEALSLPSLSSIDVEIAKELSSFSPNAVRRAALELDGLEDLDDKSAAKLAKVRGKASFIGLSFNGLQTLSEAVAKSLSNFKGDKKEGGYLSFSGLRSLSSSSASQLSKIQHTTLCLGLQSLEPLAAKALAEYKPNKVGCRQNLKLNNLTEISNEVLQKFKEYKGCFISLNGLSKVDEETAETLTFFEDGNRRLEFGETEDLNGPAKVHVGQVTNYMTPEAVRILISHFANLELNFSELSKEMASVLASNYKHKHERMKFSNDLKSCCPDALKELIKYEGTISLPGIVELDDECAEVLSTSKGIRLDGLSKISKNGALNLLKGGVETSDFKCNLKKICIGDIKEMTEISVETAELIAKGSRRLELENLNEFPDEIAKVFAESGTKFDLISLPKLTSISPLAISHLSECFDKDSFGILKLNLKGIKSIGIEVAKAFKNMTKVQVYFDGIDELSLDVAHELLEGNKITKYYFNGLDGQKIDLALAKYLIEFTVAKKTVPLLSRFFTDIDLEPIAEGFSD